MQPISEKQNLIDSYLLKVKASSKEAIKKEAFKDLLNLLYALSPEILKIIDAITAGSEKSILNIPRKGQLHRGSADTLYNKIIIEFENNLKLTLSHAKEQLAGYMLGEMKSGNDYNFTLIASDCITWKVFAVDVSCIPNLENLDENEVILNEVESASFTLNTENAEDFYYWLDRFLFKEEKQKATLKKIEEAFGYQSQVFIESYRQLTEVYKDARKYGEVQVSYEQWRKFLSIAYGTFEDKGSDFLIHTYLSVFAKMLAYAVVSNDDYIEDNEMLGILEGSIFDNYKISNFVDNDFFHWVKADKTFNSLKKVFRIIAQEISTFNFDNVDEDILKGVYQELIDLDTRHSLGEYYTPDWLCERIVKEFDFRPNHKILDPSCGSGSFLRAAAHHLRNLNPEIKVEELNNCLFGIDIHPLSVQIAKTTLLLALGKEVKDLKTPIHINIILANTLLAPIEHEGKMFGSEFPVQIDKKKFLINTQVLHDNELFDQALNLCDELAENTQHKASDSEEVFATLLKRKYPKGGFNGNITKGFYKIYEAFKDAKERGRNSIWKFILQNLYKPYFLNEKFDFVIGNPPWFTYSSIKNEEYQKVLLALAISHNIKPQQSANMPHLEIAAIFMAYCSHYFLNSTGKLAFVLPRSFYNSDHHDNTRSGKAKGYQLSQTWDLEKVFPLFRVPSCVMFADKAKPKTHARLQFPAVQFKGNLPRHNCHLDVAETCITETNATIYYAKQGKSSAFSYDGNRKVQKINPYKKLFKQGATIVPRTFYFIELNQEYPTDFVNQRLKLKTNHEILPDAKKPWKEITFNKWIESDFVYRTALAKSILPFALHDPDMVVLPILINKNDKGEKTIKLLTDLEIKREGFLYASIWFMDTENIWNQLKTEKSKNMSSFDRLNFQKGITSQNLNKPYLVLYNASAKDANATFVKRTDLDLELIIESKGYYFPTEIEDEAYYLTAILDSETPNLMMKDFQSRGLFGARDVHKKILDIYFPRFSDKDKIHLQLAEISKEAHIKTSQFLKDNPPVKPLSAIHLGKLRGNIKKHLADEMREIYDLVKKILM